MNLCDCSHLVFCMTISLCGRCMNVMGGVEGLEFKHAPDATWVMRIEEGRLARRDSLRASGIDEDFIVEMDYFQMGRYMNFFMTVGVASNKVCIAAQRDAGSGIAAHENLPIAVTNLLMKVPEGILLDLRSGLQFYRYHQHAGQNMGWARVATCENGKEIGKWFDKPSWPPSQDRQVLKSLMFAHRTENEEVWRRFLGVYRAISPFVYEFLKGLDVK